MIVVDIMVPALDAAYDFSVSESVPVDMVVEELAEIISQKEKLAGDAAAQLTLFDVASSMALDGKRTLEDYGIRTGGRLMLM